MSEVDDPRAAFGALDEGELFDALSESIDHGPHLVQLRETSSGTLISIDTKGTSVQMLESLPEMISARLTSAGITDGFIRLMSQI